MTNNVPKRPDQDYQFAPVPIISALVSKSVSNYRREQLAGDIEQGLYREGTGPQLGSEKNNNPLVLSSVGIKKNAQALSNSGGLFRGSGGDTIKQIPEVYSPLWLNSNLNLPRDRATINAWCRSFYALNPFVHNAINLHSTYPISKLNIKCPNKEIEKFFNDMIEEIDLMNICVQIAQEYWLLGESFVYSELDESRGKWSRLMIQNPDYMIVKRTVVADEPIIMLRPDENLKKIIFSNRPTDVEQRKQLNNHIIDSVKRGQNIPLNNFNVSHLARKISPYEIRGTGLPVCIFRNLMLYDNLRECYSADTEILTDQGFKTIDQLVEYSTKLNQTPTYVNGIEMEGDQISSILVMKEDFKIACVNPENHQLEYYQPTELHMSKYNGEMVHFKSKKYDTLVTPNHEMWVQKINRLQGVQGWSNWHKEKAQNINPKTTHRFLGTVSDWQGNDLDFVDVLGVQVPAKLYLKFLAYVISEGYISKRGNYIDLCQKIDSHCIDDIKDTVRSFSKLFNINLYERIVSTKDYKKAGFKKQPSDRWNCHLNSKKLNNFFFNLLSQNGYATSYYKFVPPFIKELNKELLQLFLDTLVNGDGSCFIRKYSTGWRYYTISPRLADDVQEIVLKCGYAPLMAHRVIKSGSTEYSIAWSNSNEGRTPLVMPTKYCSNKVSKVNYDGIVWCFQVPTGLFVTRRNGKLAIQGNSKFAQASNMVNPLTIVKVGSADYKPTAAVLEEWRQIFEQAQYDKDFKIFTHDAVDVVRVGYGQGIYDISGDITQLVKEIFIGLQVPPVLMDGSDTTYANGGVALDVLRQRYMQFRNMMSQWLKRKVFAPISKIQGFYDYSHGEKQLIVPEIDWNHMSLFDAGDYIQNLITLTQGEDAAKRVSLHTLYRSIGLEWEDETRKIRKEAIQNAINQKEKAALQSLDLNALRALSDDDEIPEPEQQGGGSSPAPSEAPSGMTAPTEGLPGLDLGAPPMPPPTSAPPTNAPLIK